jgi:hypothetical protein
MTRAMEHLSLTSARRRMHRGRTETQIASPFLDEIGTEMVTVEDVTTAPEPRGPWSASGGGFHADADDRRMIEAADIDEAFPPEYEYLRVGCMVNHPTYGRGRVVSRGSQPWPETRLEIHFEDLGPKTIRLFHAHLELLEE